MTTDTLADDVAAIARIDVVPSMLEVICRATGMGFAAVARVTQDRWIACAVRDEIAFGLTPGGELVVATTICDEIRDSGRHVVIDHVSSDAQFCRHPTPAMYGFESYISVPIRRVDGRFFGTLCAIDPKPARVNTPETVGMFQLFANLIALHLDAQEHLAERERSLARTQLLLQLAELLRTAATPADALGHAAELLASTLDAECRFVDLAAPIADANDPVASSMAIPLRRDVRCAASLLVSSRHARRWEAWEVELMETVADRAWYTAEKLRIARAKDEFLATLSHELRTPLNAILGWTRMLRSGTLPVDEIDQALASLERNADMQARLVEDLLDVSRIVAGKFQVERQLVDVSTVLEDLVRELGPAARARGIDMRTEPWAAAPVSGDATRLRQMLGNLMSNAIKFTQRGGRVHVGVSVNASTVELSICDTGQGIDRGFLPHVFDRFAQADAGTTREHGGLGLGLTIVRHLAEAHGGSVTAASAGPGLGATFVVSLPLSSDAEAVPGTGSMPFHETGALLDGTQILVVDDHQDAQQLLRVMLEARGAEVRLAGSAAEAREALGRLSFDVLIADIGMPEEDGLAFMRSISAAPDPNGHVPSIAVTAYAGAAEREAALEAGFGWYLTKPIDERQLLEALAAARDRRRG